MKCNQCFLRAANLKIQEKLDNFRSSALSVRKNCNAWRPWTKTFIECCSAERRLLIQTMKQDTEQFVLKAFKSVSRDVSYNYATTDNFCLSRFQFKELKKKLSNWVLFYKYWEIEWRIIAGSSSDCCVWNSREILLRTFQLNPFENCPMQEAATKTFWWQTVRGSRIGRSRQ